MNNNYTISLCSHSVNRSFFFLKVRAYEISQRGLICFMSLQSPFFPTEWRNACVLVKQLHTTTWSQDLLHTEIQDWKTLVKWALIIRMYSNVSVVWGTRMYSVFFGGNLNVEIVLPPHPQCGQCKFWNWWPRREENVNAAPSRQRPSSKYLLRQLERGLARWLSG